ncbi:MAG: Ger(x)C family spore germination protein [Clostridia bacterium]|nr:Ger(x)C family spore germination protein [Clostridia bacterium]
MGIRRIFFFACVVLLASILSGCWNYREIDQVNIVAGIAVDKDENSDGYELTAEIVEVSGGKDAKISSEIISVKGDTMFDAARNAIAISGKRLYWSHAKAIIISSEQAKEGIGKIIDWYNRDSETRADVNIIISRTKKAKDILDKAASIQEILSFEMEDMISNQASLSKAPSQEVWQFLNILEAEGVMPLIPVVDLRTINGKSNLDIDGGAVFRKDKLVGFIDGEDIKYVLFAMDRIKGGLLIENIEENGEESKVSLEIFESDTKVRPVKLAENKAAIKLEVEVVVAVGEIKGYADVINEEGRKKLRGITEASLKKNIETVIKKIQKEYKSDIFGFGEKIREKFPSAWEKMRKDWENSFGELEVQVSCKARIENSAMAARPVKAGG